MGRDENSRNWESPQRVKESGYNSSLSHLANELPSRVQDLSMSTGITNPPPGPPPGPPRFQVSTTSAPPQPPASFSRPKDKMPPLPPRKPDTLRYRDEDQSRLIQGSGEEMSFTKDDIIIAIMGVTGAGKSTFISLLSDEEIEIGHGLQSCTTKVGVYYFRYHGVRIFLVDTPGFDDTNRSDSEVLKDVAFWMAAAYSKETRLAGIIYLHSISNTRMPGSALRNLRMFNKLCGANNLNSVVLATTHWTNLKTGVSIDQETGDARIKELVETEGFWRGMVECGSQVVKHDGTRTSALDIVLNIVGRKNRIILDIQRQLIDQRRDLNDTDAAQALQAELIAERKIFQKKLADLKEEMEDAIQEGNKKAQKEIREEQAKAEAEIKKTRDETNALRTNLEKIAREKDEQFRKLQEELAQQRREYQEQLRTTTEALNAEKERQRLAAAQHERERKEDAMKAANLAEKHQKTMLDIQKRMREENDQRLVDQMERQRQDQERWYQQQREDAQQKADVDAARWEQQLELNRQRQRELMDQREEDARKLRELEREQTKSKEFFQSALKAVCSAASVGLALAGYVPWSFAADMLSRAMV